MKIAVWTEKSGHVRYADLTEAIDPTVDSFENGETVVIHVNSGQSDMEMAVFGPSNSWNQLFDYLHRLAARQTAQS